VEPKVVAALQGLDAEFREIYFRGGWIAAGNSGGIAALLKKALHKKSNLCAKGVKHIKILIL